MQKNCQGLNFYISEKKRTLLEHQNAVFLVRLEFIQLVKETSLTSGRNLWCQDNVFGTEQAGLAVIS